MLAPHKRSLTLAFSIFLGVATAALQAQQSPSPAPPPERAALLLGVGFAPTDGPTEYAAGALRYPVASLGLRGRIGRLWSLTAQAQYAAYDVRVLEREPVESMTEGALGAKVGFHYPVTDRFEAYAMAGGNLVWVNFETVESREAPYAYPVLHLGAAYRLGRHVGAFAEAGAEMTWVKAGISLHL